MKIVALTCTLALCALSLSDCGSPQTGIGIGAAIGSTTKHTALKRSWMAPGTQNEELLYVPDFFANDVNVYSYPSGKAVGKLTGFNGPQGACVDQAQNVWITNEYAADIVEYAHGGTSPIATLTETGGMPWSCSVDPTTGNLAVANYYTQSYKQGTIAIFVGASGNPQFYSDGDQMFVVYFCGYDNAGNLFVDGSLLRKTSPWGQFEYAELAAGRSSFTNLVLTPNKAITLPEGIHWNGGYVAVGDLLHGKIYRTSGAKIISTVRLKGANGATDFFIDGAQVIVGLDSGTAKLGVWNYPAGGPPARILTLSRRHDPVAEAVLSK